MSLQTDSIPLLIPKMPSADDLYPLLCEIDANRHYTNFGPLSERFRSALLAFYQNAYSFLLHASLTQSGTAALELALTALDLPKGSKVMVPAFTFCATALAIRRAGYEPFFVDVDPESWQLTVDIARAALQQRSCQAVLPVASFGLGVPIAPWETFHQETGIPVVLDSAAAHLNQTLSKTLPICFSFHATKMLSTGEGGAIICGAAAFCEKIETMTNFGLDNGEVIFSGTNSKLSEYHAAVGLLSLESLKETYDGYTRVYRCYTEVFANHPGICLQANPEGKTPTLFAVRFASESERTKTEARLTAANIGHRRYYLPALDRHPYFSDCPVAGDLPVTRALEAQTLCLPFYALLREEQLARIEGCF